MKLVLELKNEPLKNDILLYNGSGWECISKNLFMKEYNKKIADLQADNEALRKELNDFKKGANQKLKEYHDILQQLTKGE